jgi:hypothetical protein
VGLPFELLGDAPGRETIAKKFEAANQRKGDSPLPSRPGLTLPERAHLSKSR